MNSDYPHALPLQQRMGLRLRLLRRALSLTQVALADKTGLSPRRISLCEQGERHLAASEIYAVARHLDVPVAYFFDDFPLQDEVDAVLAVDPGLRLEVEKFIRAFKGVRDPRIRNELRALLDLTAKNT